MIVELIHSNIISCQVIKKIVIKAVYSAIHLKWLTYAHLVEKLCETFHLSNQLVAQIYLVDRDGTDIAVTDEVHWKLIDWKYFNDFNEKS